MRGCRLPCESLSKTSANNHRGGCGHWTQIPKTAPTPHQATCRPRTSRGRRARICGGGSLRPQPPPHKGQICCLVFLSPKRQISVGLSDLLFFHPDYFLLLYEYVESGCHRVVKPNTFSCTVFSLIGIPCRRRMARAPGTDLATHASSSCCRRKMHSSVLVSVHR